jgi:hypothetical protein
MQLIEHSDSPRYIRLHERDNVVIVVNDQGVPAGTEFADGLVTVDFVPQSHKVTLEDIPEGGQVIRYGQTIGYALQPIPRGSWVKEDQLRMPTAPPLDSLPLSTEVPAAQAPLEGLPSRVIATPTARSARATFSASPPRCSASPACWTMRSSASRTNCCPSTRTSMTWWR